MKALCGQRIRTAVDQVAHEQDARLRLSMLVRVVDDAVDQELGFVGAALQVADGVGSHVVLIEVVEQRRNRTAVGILNDFAGGRIGTVKRRRIRNTCAQSN
jgi:hypothetical protein